MIPVYEPVLGAREAELLADCVTSGWISSAGSYLTTFEERWAAYCGRAHGIAVSNGTTALEIAVALLDLVPGDEVIVPTFTIISTVNAVLRAGATPVLVDADPRTWCLDVARVEEKVGPRTRAIMPVHIYGHPVDMEPLLALAARHGIAVIEDAAEAHGAEYRFASGEWRRCGSFGDVSAFSFYANKVITTGEGGMLVTDDPRIADRARSLRNLAFNPHRRFVHEEVASNHRLTNMQAAVGVAQLERIETILGMKRQVAGHYARHLGDVSGIELQRQKPWARGIHWMVGLVLADHVSFDATRLAALLRDEGIDTRPFFVPMHEQAALHRLGFFRGEHYPVAERIGRRGLYLPSTPTLDEATVERISDVVRRHVAA
jgi:perosamine synthetase